MAKSFFEKRDFKALTALSVYSGVEASNEEASISNRNKIIIVTSFGYVMPEKILSSKFEEETITRENSARYIMQSAVNNRNEIMKEYQNESLLDTQTSFILENVKIKQFDSDATSNLPIMILFSDTILGITFGDFDQ